MKLREVRKTDLEDILYLRNAHLKSLRTAYPLNEDMQLEWYENTVCNRNGLSRFLTIVDGRDQAIMGLAGMVGIQWENRLAEMSLITHPHLITYQMVATILYWGFYTLNLETIVDETYRCNEYFHKWEGISKNLGASQAILPARKFWNGRYFESYVWTYEARKCGVKVAEASY